MYSACNQLLSCKPFILAFVLQVKVEMELDIQQYEKAKAVREEQLDRLTQICQEQAVCPSFASRISVGNLCHESPAEDSKDKNMCRRHDPQINTR